MDPPSAKWSESCWPSTSDKTPEWKFLTRMWMRWWTDVSLTMDEAIVVTMGGFSWDERDDLMETDCCDDLLGSLNMACRSSDVRHILYRIDQEQLVISCLVLSCLFSLFQRLSASLNIIPCRTWHPLLMTERLAPL